MSELIASGKDSHYISGGGGTSVRVLGHPGFPGVLREIIACLAPLWLGAIREENDE